MQHLLNATAATHVSDGLSKCMFIYSFTVLNSCIISTCVTLNQAVFVVREEMALQAASSSPPWATTVEPPCVTTAWPTSTQAEGDTREKTINQTGDCNGKMHLLVTEQCLQLTNTEV